MKIKTILLSVSISFKISLMAQVPDFVHLQGQKFMLIGSEFYPSGVNYTLTITQDVVNNAWYLSPYWNYSSGTLWGTPNTGNMPGYPNGRWIYSFTDDIGVSHDKLLNDIELMANKNINLIRACGFGLEFESGSIQFPNGCTETIYFEMVDEFLDIVDMHNSTKNQNLRIIILVGAPYKNADLDPIYNSFLERMADRFKNKSCLMGYDFINEPSTFNGGNQKNILSSRISNWHYSIKKNAPNHLTTIGYSYTIAAMIDWDPLMHPVDFASFHIYAWSQDLQYSMDKLASSLKWYSNTIKKPWIIGETGYSGTNNKISDPEHETGMESDQRDFAEFTMQRALDCNCGGYTWWQYQETGGGGDPWEDFLGIITRFNSNPTISENEKSVVQVFRDFNPNNKNISNCIKKSNYYNPADKTYLRNQGRVVDNNGNPIEDAVIERGGVTFTDENGYFKYYTDPIGNYYTLSVTAPGYNVVQISNPSQNIGTVTLNPVYYMNCWLKKWANNSNNNIAGWAIGNNDKFYPGDFDGDGVDELLCVNQNSGGWVTLLDYRNDTWNWVWSTSGSTSAGTDLYNFRNNLTVGDFDGNGKDEIFGVSSYGMRVFKWEGNNFKQLWYKSSSTHSLWPYTDNLISGDYDGDGKDEVLGNDIDNNGWITMFHYDNGNFSWGWSDEGSGSLRPYRDNLLA